MKWGVFGNTLVAFFLAEMCDKIQIATVMLGAQHQNFVWVALGTMLGMTLANAPAVWLGDRLIQRIPLRVVYMASAGIFLLLGLWAIAGPALQSLRA